MGTTTRTPEQQAAWERVMGDATTVAAQQSETLPPVIASLVDAGHAYVDAHGTIVGIASDGVEVSLGVAHNVTACVAYLADFPTPDMW